MYYSVQYEPKHLCTACKFMNKCHRRASIVGTLQKVELEAFQAWHLDVTNFFKITDCDIFKPNFAMVEVQEEVVDRLAHIQPHEDGFDDDEDWDEDEGEDD
jgi:hypothetical protein